MTNKFSTCHDNRKRERENENHKKEVTETKIFVVGIRFLWDKMIFRVQGWEDGGM